MPSRDPTTLILSRTTRNTLISGTNSFSTILALVTIQLLQGLDSTIVSTATPKIRPRPQSDLPQGGEPPHDFAAGVQGPPGGCLGPTGRFISGTAMLIL